MNSIKFGGSFSILLLITVFSFVIYNMIDAYLDASKILQNYEQKIITTDSTMFRFSESTISSYLLHAVVFIFFFLISLFLVIPTKQRQQITEIEFILPQIESKKPPPPETKRRSTVQSIDQGKHDPKKEIIPPQPSKPPSPPPIAVPKIVQQAASAPPKPIAPEPKNIPKPVPKTVDVPALVQAKPAPLQPSQSQNTGTTSAPAPISDSQGKSSSPGTTTAIAILPRVPGSGAGGSFGAAGNPPPNSNPNAPPSIAAK